MCNPHSQNKKASFIFCSLLIAESFFDPSVTSTGFSSLRLPAGRQARTSWQSSALKIVKTKKRSSELGVFSYRTIYSWPPQDLLRTSFEPNVAITKPWKAIRLCSSFSVQSLQARALDSLSKKEPRTSVQGFVSVVTSTGFKPVTSWAVIKCSIQLS